ncbi:hypothetical protein F2Q69_00001017 [Brassica cretica]|uniref:Uncharacterized protein n=1 Tax=Brassica cretica TaxID=69181 RepID=A0A8S9P449_BRACR|nr:hypothetical protein F2Q69_00001017 [Brassica cretica]
MAGVTIADADLAATFSCSFNTISPTDATLEISTVSYSSPIVAVRASTTHFLSNYQETSRIVSVFTRNTETHEASRFASPAFPQPIRNRCSRFGRTTGNSLVRLLANTAAEVAYFSRVGLTQPLIVKGKYIRASSRLETRDRGALVKVVIADSRLGFLASKPGEFNHRTGGNVRFTRLDKYERSDVAAGTLIVYPEHVRDLVQYIDLCINPIVDGLPDQGEYLPTVWDDTPKVLMEHIMVAADVFDACLLSNVLGFLGAKINGYLDEGLPLIAGRFEFARST